jgi:hypothetical protein
MLDRVKQVIAGLVAATMTVELDAEGNGQKGAEKKAEAVSRFGVALKGLLPEWLAPVVANALEFLVETAVGYIKRRGFFEQLLGTSSSAPASS